MTAVPGAAGHFPVRAHLAVAGAGLLFGSSFVPMQEAVDQVEPVPFIAVRFLIGAAVLWPLARARPRPAGGLRAAAVCGSVLASGYVFQTVGLQYTTSSVSAFITYLLVVLVPVLAALFLRRPPTPPTAAGVVLAAAGLVLLTGGIGGFGRGEALTFGCAVAFAVHIILLAEYAPRFDSFRLTAQQLAVVGGGLLLPGLFLGGYDFPAVSWLAAAYTGVMVSAVAFGLQVWGQRQVGPTRTSLLLMLEPVTAAIVGYALGERLGVAGAAGALLILAGIAVSETAAVWAARDRSAATGETAPSAPRSEPS